MIAAKRARRGSILPMLGVCLIGLFGFVALAVDLGMLAVSRTQSQNAADVAALVGTRTLNNKDGVAYSNLPSAVTSARGSATTNPHLSANFTAGQVTKIEAGQYLYDTASQTFRVATWTDVSSSSSQTPAGGGSWTAMRVTINVSQPTFFMRVFGVNTMPSGATATAVYRPRDIAFALDMTGSMAFSSTYNTANTTSTRQYQSLNPDPMVPSVGHYAATATRDAMVATGNLTNGSGEAIQRNNYTIATPGGPPIIRNFYFDPTNVGSPATVAFPLTTKADGSPNLLNAFHRWSPPESGGNSNNYVGVNYNFTGYNAFHNGTEASPKGPVPAPGSFGSMTDSGGITYVGDRWRRRTGAIDKTTTDWASGNNQAAFHAADLLGYTGANPPTAGVSPAFATDWLNFRDPLWEIYGYDLDIVKYRTQRGAANGPLNPTTYLALPNKAAVPGQALVDTVDQFKGYSMGPAYWGKTFYVWPPDPRAPVGNPGAAGAVPGDWRRRFFLNKSGGALSIADDNDTTNAVGTVEGINESLLRSSGTGQALAATTTQVNYVEILKWVKSGPQVLPPNLRAGRVLYYASIPNDVNTGTGTTQERLDKAFWKQYIDFVLGVGSHTGRENLYGESDSWASSAASVTTADLAGYKFAWQPVTDLPTKPYMRYTDSPRRPRLHMWFGPMSMVHLVTQMNGNWLPGTCYEAQCWQLKAGMNSVLDDVKNNHPNDLAGLVYFATSHHNGVRVPLGQNFQRLKNALFYPRSLLPAIDGGNITNEYRPYNTSMGGYDAAEIPNASGGTDPATGLSYAYNLLSPSSIAAAQALGTGAGRRGSQKIIILETDGVPNSYRVPSYVQRGFNSYYTLGGVGGSGTNGDPVGIGHAHDVIKQIVKPMATTATTSGAGADSGLSLPNAPARVYPIAFGDLFDEALAPSATFRPTALAFLAKCAEHGGTGPVGALTLPDTQIITGPYDQRINRLRDCLERVFQTGVSVVLIE